jgi:hypothetical protein
VGAPLETNGHQKTGDVYKCPVTQGNCTKLNLGKWPGQPGRSQRPYGWLSFYSCHQVQTGKLKSERGSGLLMVTQHGGVPGFKAIQR